MFAYTFFSWPRIDASQTGILAGGYVALNRCSQIFLPIRTQTTHLFHKPRGREEEIVTGVTCQTRSSPKRVTEKEGTGKQCRINCADVYEVFLGYTREQIQS